MRPNLSRTFITIEMSKPDSKLVACMGIVITYTCPCHVHNVLVE